MSNLPETPEGQEPSQELFKAAGDADSIDEIVLSGGGARIPFLKEILAEKHGVEISMHDPLAGIEYEEGIFGEYESRIEEIAPLLAVGVGLAMRKAGK